MEKALKLRFLVFLCAVPLLLSLSGTLRAQEQKSSGVARVVGVAEIVGAGVAYGASFLTRILQFGVGFSLGPRRLNQTMKFGPFRMKKATFLDGFSYFQYACSAAAASLFCDGCCRVVTGNGADKISNLACGVAGVFPIVLSVDTILSGGLPWRPKRKKNNTEHSHEIK